MITFDKQVDRLAIIAPSSSVKGAKGTLKEAVELLTSHGFSCQYDQDIFTKSKDCLSYFAADKAKRLEQLRNAIKDPKVKIIWAFRGGYGAGEIAFECLDIKPTTPKILIGFSDITILHVLFNQHYKMKSIHGSVINSILNSQKSMFKEIKSVLSGNSMSIAVTPIMATQKTIKAEIIGGNLTLLCNMIGTKLNPQISGKILFIEDVNEKGYHIHRHLLHIYHAGLFKGVRAIMFADFTNGDSEVEKSIKSFCSCYISDIPTYKMKGVGHDKTNYPIVIGGDAVIKDNIITINSPFKIK